MTTYNNWWEYPLERWRQHPPKRDSWYRAILEEHDSQMTRCYRAERKHPLFSFGRPDFTTLEEVKSFVGKITSRAWFKRRWGQHTIIVENRGRTWAHGCYRTRTMQIPTKYFNKMIILHELGHCITPYKTGGGHGRYWARTYIELVTMVLGKEAGDQLKQLFKGGKVKFTPKRNMSPESRAAARERFMKKLDEWALIDQPINE